MPICVVASGDLLSLYIENYYQHLDEYKLLIENLQRADLPFEQSLFRPPENNADTRVVYLPIYDLLKKVTDLPQLEASLLTGFTKDETSHEAERGQFTFSYGDSFGDKNNKREFDKQNKALIAQLDKEQTDIIDWFEAETVLLKQYKVASDSYLHSVFMRYQENENRNKQRDKFMVVAEGHFSTKENKSLLFFLPIELVLKVTEYVDPLYPLGGKKIFDQFADKKNLNRKTQEALEDEHKPVIRL